jgi:arylsulfatase A-like enzyme
MSRPMLLPLPRLARARVARVGRHASWPLQLLLGWSLAGLLNVVAGWALAEPGGARAAELLSHAVDLGRHVALGLVSATLVWAFRRWLPQRALVAWLALAAASIGLAALILPTDLEGLAERSAEAWQLPEALVMAAIIAVIGGSVPVVALLTRRRPPAQGRLARALAVLRVLLAAALAAAAFWLNLTTSPGSNPSAHLFLSWVGAIGWSHALPRFELAALGADGEPEARTGWARWVGAGGLGAALALVLAAWGAWALFGPHGNTVMIQIARRPSSLHLVALFHTDGGLDTVQAALASRAGPFFARREGLPPTPPTRWQRPAGAPIVIFFSVDSLRRDVPLDPKHARYMPNLVGLRQRGVTFESARAPGSMTKYTLSSISSGKYFSQQYWAARGQSHWPIDDTSVHLATLLSSAGVFTAAFPATAWLENGSGVIRGFEHNAYAGGSMPGRQQHWVDGATLTHELLQKLEQHAERPGFYWVHYLDTHDPFYAGGRGGKKFTRYLRALSVVDGYLGEILAAVERLGLDQRVLLFVMSDHGEAFGEHGSSFHGGSLYDELVRVPLVAKGPSLVARSVDAPVSLVDLGPTVLDWFGLATPPSFMGESLLPFLIGDSRAFDRPIVAETRLKQSMLFSDGRKVIRDLRRQTLELYDLGRDPEELSNLSDDIDPDQEEHVLLLRGFFQVHTYRENGYRVPYVK